ncbi:transcriptional regulator, SARP family [Frankia casuarinae]|uniref:Transcriptional regulator, SARP family n=1 Tax=Frankia casuarinae (strain DSM 45818 / CECT 9043 / HFP020203 / CcI3) TaxID=106370 RepID=Q2JGQ3_FRACC|nr:transcriptional regulator, SARP family [Frankia casuarinae]
MLKKTHPLRAQKDAPSTCSKRRTLYVLHIRRSLRLPSVQDSREVLVTRNHAYQIVADGYDFDRCRFDDLYRAGRTAAARRDAEAASRLLGQALREWRGPALADVKRGSLSAPHVMALEEARLHATELRIEADLALGRHHELVPELEDLISLHPMHDLHAQLMVAHSRSGHPKRAASVFRRLRSTLIDTMGIEPTFRTSNLMRAILAGSDLLLGDRWESSPQAFRQGTGRQLTRAR